MLSFEQGTTFALGLSVQASIARTITLRGMTREGPFTFTFATSSAGTVTYQSFRIPDVPIFVTVINESTSDDQGSIYAYLSLEANGDTLYQLCAGLIYGQKGISYPASPGADLRPSGGRLTYITGSNPAAGAEILETVPAGRLWKIIAMRFQLVAAAAAASRRVHVVFTDGSSDLLDCFSSVDQIISETKNYSVGGFGAVPDETDDNDILIAMPPNIMLPQGAEIKTITTNLNAGDNFGVPIFLVEEFFDSN